MKHTFLYIAVWMLLFQSVYAQMNAFEYYSLSAKIAKKDTSGIYQNFFLDKTKGSIYNSLIKGDYYLFVNDSKNALLQYNSAFQYINADRNDSLSALINAKIGCLYYNNDHYTEAIKYFNKASLFYTYRPKNMTQAKVYILLGIIHNTLGRDKEAEKAYKAAIRYFREQHDEKNKAAMLNNLAVLYMNAGDYRKAQLYFDSSLHYRIGTNDFNAMGQSYNNIGTLNYQKKEYENALLYYKKGYENRIKGNNPKSGLLESEINIGKTYRKLNDKTKALYWLEKAIHSDEINRHLEILYRGTEQLKELYRELKQYEKAYQTQAKYYDIRDSLYGLDKKIAIENFTLQNQLEIKMKADSLTASEKIKTEKILSKEQDKRNRMIVYFLLGGILFLLYFIFQLYSISNQRKKTNSIITEQKNTLHRKQTEIMDSIAYAKRIQSAILPQEKLIKSYLPETFILYKPKDIVAGDFYWFEVIDDAIYFAAADCTGHGVPGAMVSVVCNNGLNRAVREFGLTKPNEILDKTREIVIQEFEKSDEDVKDGMDISLCALDIKTNKLSWSGANNPLWILRNKEIIEHKGDKQPIGKHFDSKPFSLTEIKVEKNDLIYIFTDGYQDQFGGQKQKKFRISQMRELLLSLSAKSMEEQRKLIDESFESWKGNLEQVDDVCVIGVRV